MTALIIAFPVSEPDDPGDGAREALLEALGKLGWRANTFEELVDLILADLWLEGYRIAPIDDDPDEVA